MADEHIAKLKVLASQAPNAAGCYLMRNADGNIIYIGKAKILRNRLSSYFSGLKDIKTATLLRFVRSIETITVSNEYEALLLENTLIKEHSPKYNINLKDGKSYPLIRITNDKFPRIFKTRSIMEDGSRYFGPFPNSGAVDKLLSTCLKLYPIRKCERFRERTSPCIYYHIAQCKAPCCKKITKSRYAKYIENIVQLLEGSGTGIVVELTKKMHRAASASRYEKAAQYRDTLYAINELSHVNSVVDFDKESRDYIASASDGILCTYTVFSMRGGKLTNRELFRAKSAALESEAMETFIMSYYSPDNPPPSKIFVPVELGSGELGISKPQTSQNGEWGVGSREWGVLQRAADESPAVADKPNNLSDPNSLSSLDLYFQKQFGFVPEIRKPDEKRHLAALAMARLNAEEDIRKRLKERGKADALEELKRLLRLENAPMRIEGFDIAQLDGKHPVASLISFYNGVPDKRHYRFFKLKTTVGIVDDYASMREAVRRRYTRLLDEGKALPDMVLVDGGLGQVNAAKGVLDELGINCSLAGLAKRDEEIWLPGSVGLSLDGIENPVRLPKSSEALKVLQAVRDETHRFATGLNQKLRSKDLLFSSIESIEGIGRKRAAMLFKKFKSLDNIAAAEPQAIKHTARISLKLAKTVQRAAKLALENNAGAEL